MSVVIQQGLQQVLEAELDTLKKILKQGYELKVRWIPKENTTIFGEVKHQSIFIYSSDEEVALETLKHEFIDYTICQIIEPYKEVTNKLIALINEAAYKKKEQLVNVLASLI